MLEYLNLRPAGFGNTSGASVEDAANRSWTSMLRWLETNQTEALMVVVGLIVVATLWQYTRTRRGGR